MKRRNHYETPPQWRVFVITSGPGDEMSDETEFTVTATDSMMATLAALAMCELHEGEMIHSLHISRPIKAA